MLMKKLLLVFWLFLLVFFTLSAQEPVQSVEDFIEIIRQLNETRKKSHQNLKEKIGGNIESYNEDFLLPGNAGDIREFTEAVVKEIKNRLNETSEREQEIERLTENLIESVYSLNIPFFGFNSTTREGIIEVFKDSPLPLDKYNSFFENLKEVLGRNSLSNRQDYIKELLNLMTSEDLIGKRYLREQPDYLQAMDRWWLWGMVRGLEGLYRAMEFHRSLLNRMSITEASEIRKKSEEFAAWYKELYQTSATIKRNFPQAVIATLPVFIIAPENLPENIAAGYRNCLYAVEKIDPRGFCFICRNNPLVSYLWRRTVFALRGISFAERISFSQSLGYSHLDLEKIFGLVLFMLRQNKNCLKEGEIAERTAVAGDSEAVLAVNRTSSYVSEGMNILRQLYQQAEEGYSSREESERLVLRFLNNRSAHLIVTGELSPRWSLQMEEERRNRIMDFLKINLNNILSKFYRKVKRELEKEVTMVKIAPFLDKDPPDTYIVRNIMIDIDGQHEKARKIYYQTFSNQTQPPEVKMEAEKWGKLHGQGIISWNNLSYLSEVPITAKDYLSGNNVGSPSSFHTEPEAILNELIFPWIEAGLSTNDPVQRDEFLSRGLIQFSVLYNTIILPGLNQIMMVPSSIFSENVLNTLGAIESLKIMEITLYESMNLIMEDSRVDDEALINTLRVFIEELSQGLRVMKDISDLHSQLFQYRFVAQADAIFRKEELHTVIKELFFRLNNSLDDGSVSFDGFLTLRIKWFPLFLEKLKKSVETDKIEMIINELYDAELINEEEKNTYVRQL
jgi:hypothetical protein